MQTSQSLTKMSQLKPPTSSIVQHKLSTNSSNKSSLTSSATNQANQKPSTSSLRTTNHAPRLRSKASRARPAGLAKSGNHYVCSGCNKVILKDKYLLKACNKYWHENCLKCDRCKCRLGEIGSTLYDKANFILCRQDYIDMFGKTGICSRCDKLIPAIELVMKAKDNVYHLECFSCQLCNQRFCVGDRFYLCDNKIVCQYDYDEHYAHLLEVNLSEQPTPNNNLVVMTDSSHQERYTSSEPDGSVFSFLTNATTSLSMGLEMDNHEPVADQNEGAIEGDDKATSVGTGSLDYNCESSNVHQSSTSTITSTMANNTDGEHASVGQLIALDSLVKDGAQQRKE